MLQVQNNFLVMPLVSSSSISLYRIPSLLVPSYSFLSFLINGKINLISQIETGNNSGYQYAASRPWNKIWQKHRYKSRFMLWIGAKGVWAGWSRYYLSYKDTLQTRGIPCNIFLCFPQHFGTLLLIMLQLWFSMNTGFCKLAVDSHTELCLRWELNSFSRNSF